MTVSTNPRIAYVAEEITDPSALAVIKSTYLAKLESVGFPKHFYQHVGRDSNPALPAVSHCLPAPVGFSA